MTALYLVRHAQASFGADDYDRLSELGHRQSRWLGDYFADRGIRPDRVVIGSLRRHRETWEGIAEGLAAGGIVSPAPTVRAALDEYQSERLLAAHQAAVPLPRMRPRIRLLPPARMRPRVRVPPLMLMRLRVRVPPPMLMRLRVRVPSPMLMPRPTRALPAAPPAARRGRPPTS